MVGGVDASSEANRRNMSQIQDLFSLGMLRITIYQHPLQNKLSETVGRWPMIGIAACFSGNKASYDFDSRT